MYAMMRLRRQVVNKVESIEALNVADNEGLLG